jgi:uncharacterized membrane protein YeaQ/YmgE (transglycosylase-associated protein family)
MDLLWFCLVGLVAGWLAGVLVKGGGFGLLGDLVVGVLGALLGGWLFGKLGIWPSGGLLGAIIVATIGAVVLLVILRMIKRAP